MIFQGSKRCQTKFYPFFIMKIPNKKKTQQIAQSHSSNIDSKDFIKVQGKYTAEPYSFLVNDATLASDNPLRFRKIFFNIKCKFP